MQAVGFCSILSGHETLVATLLVILFGDHSRTIYAIGSGHGNTGGGDDAAIAAHTIMAITKRGMGSAGGTES